MTDLNATVEHSELLPMTWRPEMVLVSYLLSVQSCYAAFLILQLRFSRTTVVLAAFCFSVSGVWGMHFTGLGAMSMDTSIDLDVGWTVVSAALSFACTSVAFLTVDAKTAACLSHINEDVSFAAHVRAMEAAPNRWIACAAVLIAAGVCVMHYVGMQALVTPASRDVDFGIVAGSCLVALIAAYGALIFAFVLPITKYYTIPSAILAGVAVCGMHYSGMYGITFHLEPSRWTEPTNVIFDQVVYIVFYCSIVTFLVLAYTTFLYRAHLKRAACQAAATARHVIRGNYDVLAAEGQPQSSDPVMRTIRNSYLKMGKQLQRMKAFLPPSLLAAFEAEECGTRSDADDSDEYDTLTSGPSSRRPSIVHETQSVSSLNSDSTTWTIPEVPDSKPHPTKRVSILCINIRGFHSLLIHPGEPARVQREALDLISICVSAQKGIVDNFQGDRAVCTFNAARPSPGHVMKAATTALTIVGKGREQRLAEMTIGMSSGMCLVGVLGTISMRRLNVIGPAYSQAISLERMCKQYAVTNMCPGQCLEEVEYIIDLRCLDVLYIPGRESASVLFTIQGHKGAKKAEEWMYHLELGDDIDHTKRILLLYSRGREAEARELAGLVRQHSVIEPRVSRMIQRPLYEHAAFSQGLYYCCSVLNKDPKECHSFQVGGLLV
ncbi:Signaling protein YkoW [Diplonema papillatum]|nr:Signaling protein YkoW [Diplonema papillatum]